MKEKDILDVYAQARKIYNLLGEALDLSKQMAEAVDRDDMEAFQILLSMRRESIVGAANARERISNFVEELPADEAKQMRELLNGGQFPGKWESQLSHQLEINQRLYQQLSALDRVLNEKTTHENSVYTTSG